MKIQNVVLSLFCVVTFSLSALQPGDLLVVTVPVVDLSSGEPLVSNEGVSGQTAECHRLYQALFNETLVFVSEHENSYMVACKQAIYGTGKDGAPISFFAVDKCCVTPLFGLTQDMKATIPDSAIHAYSYLTLVYPTHNLSVGTRLIRIPKLDRLDSYAVCIADFAHKSTYVAYIPVKNAWLPKILTPQEQRHAFVTLLNELFDRVAESHKVIPYVWGGASFIYAHDKDDYFIKDGLWHRKKLLHDAVYTGYDCSDLIARFAQIVGINFPWKNTTMIKKNCKALESGQMVQEGDLIWIPGHIMIISNIEKSEIIQAHGYASGYGSVDKNHIKKVFSNISDMNALVEHYFAHKKLFYLRADGTTIPYEDFVILQLL